MFSVIKNKYLFIIFLFIAFIALLFAFRPKNLPLPKTLSPPSIVPISSSPYPTVFVIVMENTNWSSMYQSTSAPYINSLLTRSDAAYTTQYFGVAHPSEPNYIWMEAGDSLGLTNDNDPSPTHSTNTPDHLVKYLDRANIPWKSYVEGIDGTSCPLRTNSKTLYAPKHLPMIFFQDVTDNNNPNSQYCIQHIRPFSELDTDLQGISQAKYNFVVPDLCDDMHNSLGCATDNRIKNGDSWLSQNLPKILNSSAYQQNGIIFITWDESEESKTLNQPVGMIVLSPLAKSVYHNNIHYTHSSLLKTLQEIFNVQPFLRDANNANDLSDLFSHHI